jgi:hypothetical protein
MTAQTPWLVREPMRGGGELQRRFTAWYAQLQALPRRLRRALQRQLALPLVGVALLLALGPGLSHAGTIVVDGATCTLVDAITAANTDTAQGGCSAGSGADTLVLDPPGSTVMLARVDNTYYGPNGLPAIRSVITIVGQGGTIARSPSAPPFRLVAVGRTGNLTLQDVTLTGGASYWNGGGVFNRGGTITLTQSTVTGNTATYSGGGVYAIDGTVTLTQSTVTGNTASSGGGVYNQRGPLTLTQSTVTGNTASTGGGVSTSNGTVAIQSSTVSGNTGSGVSIFGYYGGATVIIEDSTIAGNTNRGVVTSAVHGGTTVTIQGGIISGNTGGGMDNADGGTVAIEGTTISGNGGDGVLNWMGTVTIEGSIISGNSGHGVHSESGYGYRVYHGADVTISHSIISGNRGHGVDNEGLYGTYYTANVTIIDSIISDNSGPGVFNSSSGGSTSVTLTQSSISGNTATDRGGGVLNYFGSVMLTQSTISGNTATDRGGGVFNLRGSVMLTQSSISGNRATDRGGGVFNYSGSVMLTQSTISGNTASVGGGVVNTAVAALGATLTLTNSTISGNRAAAGGGVVNSVDSDDSRATAMFLQSTITGNTATYGGGGVVTSASDAVSNATITLTLADSLIAGNLAPTAPEVLRSGGTLTANAFNLFGVSGSAGVVGFTPGPTDRVPSAPLTAILDPVLADHGGPTLTHALVPGSPAIDAIPRGTNGCGTTIISDQRERARPQPAGGSCDIGAYEVEVAGQALGAWIIGFTPQTATCENVTTGHEVTLSEPASPWDCEAAGLGVTAGDQVALRVRGPVEKGATDVGGAVVGMQPSSGGCTNLTTGQQVKFQHMVGATAGSCVAAGLVVHPGDKIQLHVQGVAE